MDETLFHIIELVITIIAAITARYLVPWLKAKLSADQIATLRTITEVAVLAAQQLHGNEPGGDRKRFAIAYIRDFCADHGISISGRQLDALIEAAVKTMKIESAKGGMT